MPDPDAPVDPALHVPDLSTAAKRARYARELAGLSRAQAARMLQLPPTVIEQFEEERLGSQTLVLTCLAHLPSVYGCSFLWLNTGEPLPGARTAAADLARDMEARGMPRLAIERMIQLIHMLGP